MRLFIFLPAAAVVCCVAAVHFDPAIPCKTWQDCAEVVSDIPVDRFCTNGYCVCKIGTEIKNCSSTDIGQHINRNTGGAYIFGNCRLNHECRLNNSFCNTTISRCECQKDYVLSNVRRECLKKAETADFPCVEDKQCLGFSSNTSCRDGVCSCVSGYHYAGNVCHKTIDIGAPCTREEECAHVPGARCTDRGVCDCAAETVIGPDKKKCLPVARQILDSCAEDVQCRETFANALCIDGTCRCEDRYHFEPESNRCFIDKGLDEDCGNTYECYEPRDGNATGKKLRCAENVCVCEENYAREDDRCVNESSRPHAVSLLSILFGTVGCVAYLAQY